MNFVMLIIGLLVGWAVEWVIDWLYWRRRATDSSAELENLRAQNKRLRADLDAATEPVNQLKADLAAAQTENATLRTSLDQVAPTPAETSQPAGNAEVNRLRARLNVGSGAAAYLSDQLAALRAERDSLQAENERLQAQRAEAPAGNQFATQQLSSAEVQAALELEQLRADNARLQAQLAERAEAPAGNQFATQQLSSAEIQAALELEQLRADNARLQAQLAERAPEAPAGTPAQYKTQLISMADLNLAQADGDEAGRLRGELEGANSQIAQLRAELDALRGKPARDPLIDINGIGPVIEKRLFEAGILTFTQLAAETPERLRQIAQLKDWQEADPAAWIAEARQRADQQSGS